MKSIRLFTVLASASAIASTSAAVTAYSEGSDPTADQAATDGVATAHRYKAK